MKLSKYKVRYSDLESLAMSIRDRGKKMCLVYASDFKEVKHIYLNVSKHLVAACSIYDLESFDKESCVFLSASDIKIVGYDITAVEVIYPDFYWWL